MNASFFGLGCDLVPDMINLDANSDLTGDWVNLENYERAYLLLIKPAGTAGDDLSIVINQATDNAGTGSKAVTFQRVWYKVGTMTAQNTWTYVDLGATGSADLDLVSVGGTDIASDSSAAVVLVEVMADSLDVNAGFKFVQSSYEGDDIANALLINSHWVLCGSAYPRNVPLTALS